MVKKFKELKIGDTIYIFKVDDQNYNAPGDICTVEVVDIKRVSDQLTIYTSLKSGTSPSGNETYYVYFETESDLSNDRLDDYYFATTEEEIKSLHKECIEALLIKICKRIIDYPQ